MSERPIFIVGCPRSGTTLLRDLLRAHSHISIPPESHVLPSLYAAHGDPVDAAAARRLAADLLGSFRFATWNLAIRPSQLEHHRSFAAIVDELYRSYAARDGKRRWGDKTPSYVNHLDTILEAFPDAQVICMVRDGHDVCMSLIRQAWGPANAYSAALMWQQAIRSGRRAATRLPPSTFLEVRYETLTSSLEPELRRICEFLEEPFEKSMLSPNRANTRPHPIARPPRFDHAVSSENFGRWRTAMPAADRDLFETVAGAELTLAGYELAGRPRPFSSFEGRAWKAQSAVKWLRWQFIAEHRRPRARSALHSLRARLRLRRSLSPDPDRQAAA